MVDIEGFYTLKSHPDELIEFIGVGDYDDEKLGFIKYSTAPHDSRGTVLLKIYTDRALR